MNAPPFLAERFVLEHVAGSGGMGVVYRGRDAAADRDVAVKVLHAADAAGRARFEREAAALASLEHEAIVGYVAHGAAADGRLYLVTEWVDGETLHDRLGRGPLSVSATIAVGRRVASALAASHARGIVHRDVKPSNVLLRRGEPGSAMLIDFGIARAGLLSKSTQTGIVLGTPGYMAPEQARGETDVDGRADLFSLGCVLHEAIAGAAPFDGEHLMAILAKILLQPAAPLATVRPGLPIELSNLVERLLAKSPEERPESAEAVSRALAEIELDPATDAPPSRLVAVPESLAAEVRLVSVVLITDHARAGRHTPARVEGHPASERPTVEIDADLSDLVAAFDATIEVLADGSHLVVFTGTRAATDQAAIAARCAQRIREKAPSTSVVTLATGRGRRDTQWPVGEAIDRAVQLARRAADGAPLVWIDEITRGLLDSRWEIVPDGDAARLGREASEVDDARKLLGKPTPFVGRAREIRMLENEVMSAFEDREATAVVVKGAAGIGKSRLRAEVLRRLGRDGRLEYALWTSRADATRRASPLGIAGQIVRIAAGVAPGEAPAAARRKLWAAVAERVGAGDAARVAAFLAEIAGVSSWRAGEADTAAGERAAPTPTPQLAEAEAQILAARRDPLLLGDQMQRAFEDFVVASCAGRPVLIVVEDLHWADGPSVRFLDGALRQAKSAPLCVAAFGRPEVDEVFPRLWADRRLVEVRLHELSDKAAEELAVAVLGPAAERATIDAVVARAAGNALCLEELIRAAAEGNTAHVPGTVLAIAQARLGALDAPLRRVLRAASVLGGVFWRGATAALLGGEARTPDLGRALRELSEREVIERELVSRFPGDEQYTFRHVMLRDAAYAMLADEDRAGAHAAAADWLAAQGETDARVVANHLSLAGRSEHAPRWLLRAAEQALEAGDLAGAVALCEHGLDVLGRIAAASSAATLVAARAAGEDATVASAANVERSPARPTPFGLAGPTAGRRSTDAAQSARRRPALTGRNAAIAGAIQLLLAEAQRWRGDFASCEEAALQAIEVLPRGERSWLRAVEEALVAAGRRGDRDAVRELGTKAHEAPVTGDAAGAKMSCICAAARHFLHAGDLAEADTWMARAEIVAAEVGSGEPRVLAEMFRLHGARARQIGDPIVDHEAYGRALAELVRAGDSRAACNARTSFGFSCIQLGDYDRAERELRCALAEAERLGLDAVRVRALQNLGLVHLAQGDHGRAMALEEQVVVACQAQGNTRFEAWTRVYIAMIAERAGDGARAAKEAERALLELDSAPSARAGALAVWARALAKNGDVEGARAKAGEALAILDRLGGIEEFEPLVRAAYAEIFGMGDRRAHEVARAGVERLAGHAARLADEAQRAAYLDGIAEHRALRRLASLERRGALS